MMDNSTWFSAGKAKDIGLVDRIIGEDDFDPAVVVNAIPGTELTEEMRAIYAKHLADEQEPALDPKPDESEIANLKILLNLEKNRFY